MIQTLSIAIICSHTDRSLATQIPRGKRRLSGIPRNAYIRAWDPVPSPLKSLRRKACRCTREEFYAPGGPGPSASKAVDSAAAAPFDHSDTGIRQGSWRGIVGRFPITFPPRPSAPGTMASLDARACRARARAETDAQIGRPIESAQPSGPGLCMQPTRTANAGGHAGVFLRGVLWTREASWTGKTRPARASERGLLGFA